jgi:hypothetical protein
VGKRSKGRAFPAAQHQFWPPSTQLHLLDADKKCTSPFLVLVSRWEQVDHHAFDGAGFDGLGPRKVLGGICLSRSLGAAKGNTLGGGRFQASPLLPYRRPARVCSMFNGRIKKSSSAWVVLQCGRAGHSEIWFDHHGVHLSSRPHCSDRMTSFISALAGSGSFLITGWCCHGCSFELDVAPAVTLAPQCGKNCSFWLVADRGCRRGKVLRNSIPSLLFVGLPALFSIAFRPV